MIDFRLPSRYARRVRIALFVTCLTDTLFPSVGRATVEVLERLGHEVVFPREQTCCGQMHRNSGHASEARILEQRFASVFDEFDVVVTPSGSCAAHVRTHGGAAGLRTWELSQLLFHHLGVTDVGARFPRTVAYHPTCHSLRLLRVGEAPERLLASVAGLELVELTDADECCGFGGTFAVKNADVSAAILEAKVDRIEESGAAVVCACDASCLMQIGGALERRRSPVETMHLAEVLAS